MIHTRRILVALCLVAASGLAIANLAAQPVFSQTFVTVTSFMTYVSPSYSTSTSYLTYIITVISSSSFFTYYSTIFSTTTSIMTYIDVAYSTTTTSTTYPSPTFSSAPYAIIPLTSYFADIFYALFAVWIAYNAKSVYKRASRTFRRRF